MEDKKTDQAFILAEKYRKEGLTVKEACEKANISLYIYNYRRYAKGKHYGTKMSVATKRKYNKKKPELLPITPSTSKVIVFDIPTQAIPSFLASLQ